MFGEMPDDVIASWDAIYDGHDFPGPPPLSGLYEEPDDHLIDLARALHIIEGYERLVEGIYDWYEKNLMLTDKQRECLIRHIKWQR